MSNFLTANYHAHTFRCQHAVGNERDYIEAAIKMIEELGGVVVKVVFLMELAGLKGRERLSGYDVESVICYEGK